MRIQNLTVLAAGIAVVAACSSQPAPSVRVGSIGVSPPTTQSAILGPSPIDGGCGSTQVFAGPGPDGAGIDAVPGLDANQWALASPSSAGLYAYFWGDSPLLVKAPPPPGKGNKILWISHSTALGTLFIVAHPTDASVPPVRFNLPGDGFAFPSTIDLSAAGCWHLELTIGTEHATMDLLVAE